MIQITIIGSLVKNYFASLSDHSRRARRRTTLRTVIERIPALEETHFDWHNDSIVIPDEEEEYFVKELEQLEALWPEIRKEGETHYFRFDVEG